MTKYINRYLEQSVFPSKYQWKRITNRSVNSYYDNERHSCVLADREFERFQCIHNSTSPLYIWKCAETSDEIVRAFSATKLLVSVDQWSFREQTCKGCGHITCDIKKHIIAECPDFYVIKSQFLEKLKTCFGIRLYEHIHQADSEHFIRLILSANTLELCHIDSIWNASFINTSAAFIHSVFEMYDCL